MKKLFEPNWKCCGRETGEEVDLWVWKIAKNISCIHLWLLSALIKMFCIEIPFKKVASPSQSHPNRFFLEFCLSINLVKYSSQFNLQDLPTRQIIWSNCAFRSTSHSDISLKENLQKKAKSFLWKCFCRIFSFP